MTNDEAKKNLALYRPGTLDRSDPAFKEALDLAASAPPRERWHDAADPELARWFLEHRSSYLSIRAKMQHVPVPPGLLDRILAQGETQNEPVRAKVIPFHVIFLRAAAVVVLALGLTALLWHPHPKETEFDTYRTRMSRTALQPYGMEMESHDLASINAFLAKRKAPADYVLPEGMGKARPVGCAIFQWQGAPVSMLCFHSGKPLASGEQSDLWLFVIDQSAVKDGPATRAPVITQVKELMTAAWSQGGKIYLMAAEGDREFLGKYF